MKSTLEQLKLIDYLTTEIQIERRVFVEKLKGHVDHGNTGIIFSTFEAFSSSKNEYKGIVNFDSYKIRRRRKLFDMNISLAIAEGTFRENQGLLIIESTIKGFHGVFIPFIVFILLFYIAFISVFIFSDAPAYMGWFFVPLIFIHALIMLGVPYLMMRRGVSRMKYELERDFFYMTK